MSSGGKNPAERFRDEMKKLGLAVSIQAAVGSLDTTTAKALSPTVQFSVATSPTNLTTHIGLLESLN